MANRWGNQFQKTLQKEVWSLFLNVSIGATGAPTIVRSDTNSAKTSQGVASIVRNSTGDYTITLQDPWNNLLGFDVNWDESANGGTAPLAPSVFVKARSVGAAGGGTIRFVTGNYTNGAATDPANGEIMLIELVLGNSSAV